jgi:large subunit ribosomal protein L9
MEVILLQDVEKLGFANDIVTVKSGYGRNFLIPQGLAKIANEGNKKVMAEIARQREQKEAKIVAELQTIADKLTASTLKVGAKVGTSGKIFGSVTQHQLADAIKSEHDMEIDRKKIEILGDVKNVGTYNAKISLHREVIFEVPFEVVPE